MILRASDRPLGLWILTFGLLLSPPLHLLALITNSIWLNFGNPSLWDTAVYLVIAPMVGYLLLSKNQRARFSAYVFFSCELLRAQRIESLELAALAILAILYLQMPKVRRIHPSIQPRQVLSRMGIRRGKTP